MTENVINDLWRARQSQCKSESTKCGYWTTPELRWQAVLQLDQHRGGIHAPLALRCVALCCARTVCYISLKIIVLVFQAVIYTSPQLLLSRKCAMALLGPMSPSLRVHLASNSPTGLFGTPSVNLRPYIRLVHHCTASREFNPINIIQILC
jgi:hypothetical protein